jgi:hypothetical protein
VRVREEGRRGEERGEESKRTSINCIQTQQWYTRCGNGSGDGCGLDSVGWEMVWFESE